MRPDVKTPPIYFILTVLGFSFWFLMVVPFASHRESYAWLAGVDTQTFTQQFTFGLSSTYRPLAQVVTWFGFVVLNPHIFPTSVLRQTVLQGIVYGLFVFAWWLIYSAAPQKRLLSLVAFVAGGVFFSGYIHLFHIYGMFYVPPILTLGALLYFQSSGNFEAQEVWFAVVAILLVLWHPFATALFMGFYFGFYLETFSKRTRSQHLQSLFLLVLGTVAIAMLVVIFPRAHMPLDTKMFGFLVSYQTNEVNRVASLVAFLMTQLAIFSTAFSSRLKWIAAILAAVLSAVFLMQGLPLLLLWLCAVLVKLFCMHRWSLFFLALTAAILPFGGAIGSPAYVLFAVVVAVYATSLGWTRAEESLSFLKPQYVAAIIAGVAVVVLLVRAGIEVPVVTRVANPLLSERERTYQLENILAWLHTSNYCGYDIAFAENAGSPINDVQNAITRHNRPPAWIQDVRTYWNHILQCHTAGDIGRNPETAVVTFGGQDVAGFIPVFKVPGKYGGDATVWIRETQIHNW